MNFLDMTEKEAEELMLSLGQKAFRGRQFFRWMQKGVGNIDEMTDMPESLRNMLKEKGSIDLPGVVRRQKDSRDGTEKYLLELTDGNRIEAVFMRYRFGNSLCISSQAGCRMGCRFCASTIGGLNRSLTAGEMMGQVLKVSAETGEKINRVVVMGTGEPFDNYENLARFIEIINSDHGLNMGMRNITVSTCGIASMIERFGRDFPQVNLAISLHGADDEVRDSIMPVNRKFPLEELMGQCKRYTEDTGRRITFEYALISGVNDRDEDVAKLVKLLKGMLCHVNLIRMNPVAERDMKAPDERRVVAVEKALEDAGIAVTVRRQLGANIDGACGQLRLQSADRWQGLRFAER